MKHLIFIFLSSLLLLASECKKEGKNCHYHINIVNNDSNDIIVGTLDLSPSNKCFVNEEKKLATGNTFEFRAFKFCIEKSMSNTEVLHIYIIDPVQFNIPGNPYGCDSIEIMNKVLAHHALTLQDLKDNDFTVTYP